MFGTASVASAVLAASASRAALRRVPVRAFARSRHLPDDQLGDGVAPQSDERRVGGTNVPAKLDRFFVEPHGTWTPRDRKLEKRVDKMRRRQRDIERYAFVRKTRGDRHAGTADGDGEWSRIELHDDADADELRVQAGVAAAFGSARGSRGSASARDSGASSVRQLRVARLVQDALSEAIENDYREPGLDGTLLRTQLIIDTVRMTRDTRVARVYWSTFSEERRDAVHAALKRTATQLRHFVQQRINLKYAPELMFMSERHDYERRMAEAAVQHILAEDDHADLDDLSDHLLHTTDLAQLERVLLDDRNRRRARRKKR